MIANQRVSGFLIAASLAVAIIVTIVPLPTPLLLYRPDFFVSTVLFWVLMQPLRFGLGMAWCCGILIDVIYGTPLTQHGLALVVAAYLTIKLRELLWFFPRWQQALILLGIFAVYEFVLFWIDGIIGYDVDPLRRWLPALTSAIVWPFLSLGLERIAQHDVR